jgi:hypothetical protein
VSFAPSLRALWLIDFIPQSAIRNPQFFCNFAGHLKNPDNFFVLLTYKLSGIDIVKFIIGPFRQIIKGDI